MFARRALAGCLALAVASASICAFGEPSASDKETARALMKEGDAKRKSNDLQGAYKAFKAAHAIMGVPTTGFELGRTEADLGMLVEARDTLLAVTRTPVAPGESEAFAIARAEAQKLADEIEPRIASLRVIVTGAPDGASVAVTIDGQTIPAATIGVARKHNPGKHDIVVVVGSVTRKTNVELKEGDSRDVTVDVATPAEVAPPADDAPAESSPPDATPPRTSPLVYVGFGGAAVFAAVGAITGVMAFSKASSAKDGCDGTRCPPSTHDDIASSKTFGTVSTVAFVLTGAGLVVGTVGLFSSGGSSENKSVSLAIGASSLTLVGRF
jgi:hypothetical protein